MIFVTVGTQLPFDRMMEVVEKWAVQSGKEVFCQTGPTEVVFNSCKHKEFITPKEYGELMDSCELIVAHAGIGSILSAMEHEKPIIIFPRKASLGEHRNEHQLATAKQFEHKPGVHAAYSNEELIGLMDTYTSLDVHDEFSPHADDSLIMALRDFINN